VRRDVLDLERHDVAAAQLAVDGRSRVRPWIWSLVRIDQTSLGRSGGFAPISLPLFRAMVLGAAGAPFSSSCMVVLLGY
jgi:hypothetical protein